MGILQTVNHFNEEIAPQNKELVLSHLPNGKLQKLGSLFPNETTNGGSSAMSVRIPIKGEKRW